MSKLFAGLGLISLFAALPAAAQNMPSFTSESAPAAAMAVPSEAGPGLAGRWSYRSYLNTADHAPFGAGIFTFETPDEATVTGTLDLGGGLVLDLEGSMVRPEPKGALSFEIIGTG